MWQSTLEARAADRAAAAAKAPAPPTVAPPPAAEEPATAGGTRPGVDAQPDERLSALAAGLKEGSYANAYDRASYAAATAGALAQTEQLVPGSTSEIKAIGTLPLWGAPSLSSKYGVAQTGTIAIAGKDGNIMFNRDLLDDPDRLASVVSTGHASGHFANADKDVSGMRYAVSHEIGHMIADNPKMEDHVHEATRNAVEAMGGKLLIDTTGEIHAGGANGSRLGGSGLARLGVSNYAASNTAEMQAELWAEYTTSSSPRPPAQAYGDTLVRLAGGTK